MNLNYCPNFGGNYSKTPEEFHGNIYDVYSGNIIPRARRLMESRNGVGNVTTHEIIGLMRIFEPTCR